MYFAKDIHIVYKYTIIFFVGGILIIILTFFYKSSQPMAGKLMFFLVLKHVWYLSKYSIA